MSASESPAEDAAETPAERRRPPTRELLPTGPLAIAAAVVGLALLIMSFVDFGFGGRGLIGAVFCPVLIVLAIVDVKHHVLPNDIVAPAVIVVGAVVAVAMPHDLVTHLAAGAALGFFFLAFALVFPGSLGMGDAKLGFLLGLALGSRTLPAVMVALVGLLIAALWILARQGVAARRKAIPFGPFLALGGILAFFLG